VTVGLLHPGSMGAAIGAQLVSNDVRTLWVEDGRGAASRKRAEDAGLVARPSLGDLAECSIIVSICPPASAVDVAKAVATTEFQGVYLDANAISPGHACEIETLFAERGGVVVVDGGVVGPPPRKPGTSRLYLSGPDDVVREIRDLFAPTTLQPIVLKGPVGQASALKLSFATYNKISYALAAQAYALADHHGVYDELRDLAGAVLPNTPFGKPEEIATAGQRAWRWEGEMAEIGAACVDAAVPDDMLRAAEGTFAAWTAFKDDETVTVQQLLTALTDEDP
jgi:3-hydroxyisobutyrate dehydrogenase-like beta-hydroxyacid dehydrogenase